MASWVHLNLTLRLKTRSLCTQIAGTNLAHEIEAIHTHLWDAEQAIRKSLELRTALFGERDLRTAEAIFELALTDGVDDGAIFY